MFAQNSWEEKRAFDQYEDQREIEKAHIKTVNREALRLESQKLRYQLKEEEAERKRSIYEELLLTQSGELQLITKNLRVDAAPRHVSNISSPALTILERVANGTEKIYLLDCMAGSRKAKVFFFADKAGDPNHLLKKLGAEGIVFFLDHAKAKELVSQLIALLLERCPTRWLLADLPGWLEMDGQFYFIEEEMLTWKKAKKLAI